MAEEPVLLESAAALAKSVGGPAAVRAADIVSKGMSAAKAASMLASGNFLGGALGMANAVGGPKVQAAVGAIDNIATAGTTVFTTRRAGSGRPT